MIGQSDYLGFGFTTLNWKPFYSAVHSGALLASTEYDVVSSAAVFWDVTQWGSVAWHPKKTAAEETKYDADHSLS